MANDDVKIVLLSLFMWFQMRSVPNGFDWDHKFRELCLLITAGNVVFLFWMLYQFVVIAKRLMAVDLDQEKNLFWFTIFFSIASFHGLLTGTIFVSGYMGFENVDIMHELTKPIEHH